MNTHRHRHEHLLLACHIADIRHSADYRQGAYILAVIARMADDMVRRPESAPRLARLIAIACRLAEPAARDQRYAASSAPKCRATDRTVTRLQSLRGAA